MTKQKTTDDVIQEMRRKLRHYPLFLFLFFNFLLKTTDSDLSPSLIAAIFAPNIYIYI